MSAKFKIRFLEIVIEVAIEIGLGDMVVGADLFIIRIREIWGHLEIEIWGHLIADPPLEDSSRFGMVSRI